MIGYHVNMLFCRTPTVGMHTAVYEADFSCPASDAYAGIKNDVTGVDHADGLGGTISIDHADDHCVTGSYNLQFDGGGSAADTLTGQFAAIVCP